MAESKQALEFREWFSANGGFIHPHIHLKQVDSGLSVCASATVPADATVLTCPFALAITPALCTAALSSVFGTPAVHAHWTEKQLICAYVCLHWVLSSAPAPALAHRAYLDILPRRETLRTPLHFTEAESRAFGGTNLYRTAVETRRAEWQREWQECQRDIAAHDAAAGNGFTWDHYLTAATYLSSRAFPSTILSATPSLLLTPASHPVLLPGIDSLNHAHGAPVSWVVSNLANSTHTSNSNSNHTPNPNPASNPADAPAAPAPALAVDLVLHSATPPGAALANNYGPKPNAELVLGYGFALRANPADTIVLQIGVGGGGGDGDGGGGGGGAAGDAQGKERTKLEVGRNARGAEAVWAEVLALVSAHAPAPGAETAETAYTYEDALDAAGVLGDMLLALQDRLPDAEAVRADDDVRPEVGEMLECYVEGQRDILRALLEYAQGKERAAVDAARAQGIDLVFADDGDVEDVEDVEDEDEDEEDSDEADADADEQHRDA